MLDFGGVLPKVGQLSDFDCLRIMQPSQQLPKEGNLLLFNYSFLIFENLYMNLSKSASYYHKIN